MIRKEVVIASFLILFAPSARFQTYDRTLCFSDPFLRMFSLLIPLLVSVHKRYQAARDVTCAKNEDCLYISKKRGAFWHLHGKYRNIHTTSIL